jgi:DNA-binding transcriptional ArsR family regulator
VELWKRVTVGPDVFEALSSEERISILKLLDTNKQMTGTDVANVLGISKSSAFKQLNRLARAGLVDRMDEGRKWIYYRNTSKAERLLHPEDVTITLVLGAAVAAIVVGLLILVSIHPIIGPGTYEQGTGAPSDPAVLVLTHPSLSGNSLLVGVASGSAELNDLSVFVADRATGAVVTGVPSASGPTAISYSTQPGRAEGPSVTVIDANGDGLLNAGDSIAVSGLPSGEAWALWVASSSGEAIAHADLSG